MESFPNIHCSEKTSDMLSRLTQGLQFDILGLLIFIPPFIIFYLAFISLPASLNLGIVPKSSEKIPVHQVLENLSLLQAYLFQLSANASPLGNVLPLSDPSTSYALPSARRRLH